MAKKKSGKVDLERENPTLENTVQVCDAAHDAAPEIAVSMAVENWPVERLIPYDKNPRKNAGAVDAVAASIQEFGFRQPIVVDPAGVIIIGHTRRLAAMKLGLATVPVHVATDMSAAQVKALRIVDNKTSEFAEWDFDALTTELATIQNEDCIGAVGFSTEEINRLIASVSGEVAAPETGKEFTEEIEKDVQLPVMERDPRDPTQGTCPHCGGKFQVGK